MEYMINYTYPFTKFWGMKEAGMGDFGYNTT